jgi:hypothetical protein
MRDTCTAGQTPFYEGDPKTRPDHRPVGAPGPAGNHVRDGRVRWKGETRNG